MSNVQYHYADKVVIVTGGASGIGAAVVSMFAMAGANVVLADINQDWQEAIQMMYKTGVTFVPADVSVPEDCERVAKVAIEKFGKIDVLINNAGIEFNDKGNIVTMPYEHLFRIIQVNLFGYMHMVRVCVPHMKFGGRVINVSSLQGLAAAIPGTSYQISKSGILGLTKALAIEYAEKGITVNCVLPGAIRTEGMGAARAGDSSSSDPLRRRIPTGRRGNSFEVAAPILFLASDAASYMTGSEVVVDGGLFSSLSADDPSKSTPNVPNDPDR